MSRFWKISEASSIGLHAMSFLAAEPGKLHTARDMAKVFGFSAAHLAKVMQLLHKAGLVRAVRGPSGGFQLARPASEITLLQVFEAIEGKLAPVDCLLEKPVCKNGRCILGGLLKEINQRTLHQLRSTRLADLADSY